MKHLTPLFLLALACSAHADDGAWQGLWHNADQRGEALLQRGQAAQAAKVYRDPRRRAYATLVAGDYAKAAQDMQAFDDSDAHYNRGNALAHAGDLRGAIAAYDAALKRDPNNRDARHNRDIVAKALKQQTPKKEDKQASSGKNPDDKNSSKQNNKSGKAGSQGSANGQGQDTSSQSAHSNPPGKQAKSQQGHAQAAGNGQGKPTGQNQSNGAQKPPSGAAQSGEFKPSQAQPSATNGPAGQPEEEKDSAEQARRDAAASLNAKQPGAPQNTGHSPANTGDSPGEAGQASSAAATPSEKQLAQEQWLRSIPDDPGGLLRRKFLIEHLIRQQKAPQ